MIPICLLLSCHSHKQAAAAKEQEQLVLLDDLAKEKFGERYRVQPSEDGNYSLVVQKTKKFEDLGFDVD